MSRIHVRLGRVEKIEAGEHAVDVFSLDSDFSRDGEWQQIGTLHLDTVERRYRFVAHPAAPMNMLPPEMFFDPNRATEAISRMHYDNPGHSRRIHQLAMEMLAKLTQSQ